MKYRMIAVPLAALALIALVLGPAQAVVQTVQVSNFVFTPSDVTIGVGDTVHWVWVSGTHTTTSGTPCTPDGKWNAPINSATTTFDYTFTTPGDYPYFCTFHCGIGMTGMIHVIPTVLVSDFTFSPQTVSVDQGGKVRWVWVSGTHTATSGASCTPDGMFDAPIDQAHQSFVFTFSTAGEFPYFCTFHCGMGMTGVVEVGRPANTPNSSGDLPSRVKLTAAPNPFQPSTNVAFQLPQAGAVRVAVFDASGRQVALLADGVYAAGAHTFTWNGKTSDGSDAPSGVYYARSQTSQGNASTVLVKLQ